MNQLVKIISSQKNKVFIAVIISLSIFSVNSHSVGSSTVSIVPGMYAVTAEIEMPHLRENLRYATTQTIQCLGPQDAFKTFPILGQASFHGCDLVKNQNDSQLEFDLVCSNQTAASGLARFVIGEAFFRANLNVKMGGKNMKFTQMISGQRTGECKQTE